MGACVFVNASKSDGDVSSGAGIVVTCVVSGLAARPFKLSRCAGKHGFCNLYRKGIAAFVWWSSNNQLEN